jgi:hypothetical protein
MKLLRQLFLELILLVYKLLLPLYVLEHILALGEDHIVREYLRILVVEGTELGETNLGLSDCVSSL